MIRSVLNLKLLNTFNRSALHQIYASDMGTDSTKSNKRRTSPSPSPSIEEEKRRKHRKRSRDEEDKKKKRSSRDEKSHKHLRNRDEKDKRSKEKEKHNRRPKDKHSFEELSENDYFSKNNEFSTWLKEEKGIYFSDLSSDACRELFSVFVKKWNSWKLESRYYEGIAKGPRSSHNWKIKSDK